MVLEFKNDTTKLTIRFYENMVKVEARYLLNRMPKDADKRPMKFRKLKSGKVSAKAEVFIPNGFIFDALCINDEEVKSNVSDWLEKLVDTITEKRKVENNN